MRHFKQLVSTGYRMYYARHMNASVMHSDSSTELRPAPSGTEPASAGSFILYVIIAFGIALLMRLFVAEPFIVQGSSMEPTFYDYHYLIVDRLVYAFGAPVRGDVVVFKLPRMEKRDLIKRIIGVPGDTVSIEGSTVTITNAAHPTGFVLNEPYLDPANVSQNDHVSVTLGNDEYFVLGDNRRVSADSRSWGKLPRQNIIGRVDVRLFPFNKISILPGEHRYPDTGS